MLPEFPNNIGKTRAIKRIDGKERHFLIEDEIYRQVDIGGPIAIAVLQKMRHVEEDRVYIRSGYYMIGVKPKSKGRWVWGQYCPIIPKKDLYKLYNEAKRRNW